MRILSINEGINASVVIIENGQPIFALQEERVVKQKEFVGFPEQALKFSLEYLKLDAKDIDKVCLSNISSPAFSHKDFLKAYADNENTIFYSLLKGNIKAAVRRLYHYTPALRKLRVGLSKNTNNNIVEQKLKSLGFENHEIIRTPHHKNHAAASYFGLRSDDEPYLVLSLDGGGDGDCSHVYIGEKGQLKLVAQTQAGHSLGQIYSRVTYLLGMKPHEHEYKLMGMAPYASPKYAAPIVEKLHSYLCIDSENPMQFKRTILESTEFVHARMEKDFRRARFDSVAGGLQTFTEELLLEWVKNCIKETGISRILGTGGVFMNVKANKLISQLDEVDSFDVFPSCGDETLPFGAGWLCANETNAVTPQSLQTMYLGPDGDFDIADLNDEDTAGIVHEEINNPIAKTVELLSKGEIVARCSGQMEFGARALGNRSLLADPLQPNVIPTINKMIKQRDFWMPFAPVMLAEHIDEYLQLPKSLKREKVSPYMMHSFDTTKKAQEMTAAVHPYDHSARAQIVSQNVNADLHAILTGFYDEKGRSVLLNTSYNLHGLPIVMGVKDALMVMRNSDIKHLMVNNHYFYKK